MKYSASFYAIMIFSVMLSSGISKPLTNIIYMRKMGVQKRDVMRGLTMLAIEKALSKLDSLIRGKVANELYNEYNCYFPDCYEHPEYLEKVLRSVLGPLHGVVIETIVSELIHNDDEGLQEFAKVLRHQGECPVAEEVMKHQLTLPVNPYMTEDGIYVVESLSKVIHQRFK